MRYALAALLSSALGCGAATAARVEAPARCEGGLGLRTSIEPERWALAPDAVVDEVQIRGLRTVPERLVRDAIGARLGTGLDPEWLREDLSAIVALGAFSDARADVEPINGGLILTYHVVERPLIAGVAVEGSALPDRGYERPRAGEVYDPDVLRRATQRLVAHHRAEGYFEAQGTPHAQAVDGGVAVCLELVPGRMRRIASITIDGNESVSDAELLEALDTHGGRSNVVGGVLDEASFAAARDAWLAGYFDRGRIQAEIGEVEGSWDTEGRFHVRVPVAEGAEFRLAEIQITGDLAAPAARYRAALQIDAGEVFNRSRLVASMEALLALEESLGRERDRVQVIPITEISVEEREVRLTLEVQHSPAPEQP